MIKPCRWFVVELPAWLAGEIEDPAEKQRVAAHLDDCAECRKELARFRKLDRWIGAAWPRPRDPGALAATFAARLAKEIEVEERGRRRSWAAWLWRPSLVPVAAGVAGAAMVLSTLGKTPESPERIVAPLAPVETTQTAPSVARMTPVSARSTVPAPSFLLDYAILEDFDLLDLSAGSVETGGNG